MKFQELIDRKQREYGSRFDASALDPRFVPYFENGQRIMVETMGRTLTGTVGITTGWKPCFLLMRISRAFGSPWTLGISDRIVAVKQGQKYCAVVDPATT